MCLFVLVDQLVQTAPQNRTADYYVGCRPRELPIPHSRSTGCVFAMLNMVQRTIHFHWITLHYATVTYVEMKCSTFECLEPIAPEIRQT
jgi:hypothetical protein